MAGACEFRRARRPEQIEARRASILEAAEAILAERPLAVITLRELAGRVGLAKSNVLRYFGSREAILLEVLDRRWRDWLDDLAPALRAATPEPVPYGRAVAVATTVARSLLARPLLCELLSAMPTTLEHNITLAYARDFKARAAAHSARLRDLVLAELPQLGRDGAARFAGAVVVITGGLWPHTRPSPAVARACAELGHPPVEPAALVEGLVDQLIGLCVRLS
ncbi:MAG TPA: TetR family transcriptional regulator [Pseudonocardiaceae bacterium]